MNRKFEILIVDDAVDMISNLQDVLEAEGYGATVVGDGQTALALCRERVFDLAIIDIKLPDIVGVKLIEKLVKLSPQTEYIIITGHASLESAIEAVKQRGIVAYETKPLDMEHLLSIIRQVTERKQAQEELRESQRFFSGTLNNLLTFIGVLEPDGKVIFVNNTPLDAAGIKLEDVVGKMFYDTYWWAYSKEARQTIKKDIERCASGETFVRKIQAQMAGGSLMWIEYSMHPIYGEEGKVKYLVPEGRDITERKRAEQEARVQGDVLEAINKVFRETLVCESDEEVARSCLAVAEGLTDSKFGWIGEVNQAGRLDTIALSDPGWNACRVPRSNSVLMVRDMEIRGIWGRVLRDEQSQIVNDPAHHPARVGVPEGHPILTSFLGVPLKHAGRTIGMIALGNKDSGYDLADQQNVEALSIAFVEALMRKRAEEALRRRNRELTTLNAIAQSLGQSMRLADVLQTALDSVLEAMDVPVGVIRLLDEDAGELVLAAYRGVSENFVEALRGARTLGVGISGRAVRAGKVIIVPNIREDERVDADAKFIDESEGIRSRVAVPLKSKERTLGVLNVATHSQRDFTDEDIRLLETIGNQIAVAIENARLLERTRQLSVTDELTGLYNRRHFYEVLETEMARTQRYGHSFCVAMLDLDGFKEYNDRFGHINGDSVLESLAQTLKSSLRKADVAFRYGGDEFAVVLPATDADRAKEIVDRIRSKWLRTPKAEYTILETPLGFSAGIAQFPESAESVDGLVFLADTALLYAKGQGGYKCTLVSEVGDLPPGTLHEAMMGQVYALAATVDARDPYTYGHSKRVAAIAESIGKPIELSQRELADLHAAALLHDIGKVGVPDSILGKYGKLTSRQWEIMKKHSSEAARIVGHIKGLAAAVPMIRHHHEWYDGAGYPDGLKGEDIPLGSRIISIADAYDTMTTPRLYRDVISQEAALEELRRCAGTQFDPELVEMFCRAITETVRQVLDYSDMLPGQR